MLAQCFCDPEGGALKNAARREELRGHEDELERAHILKSSWDLFSWASGKSGLAQPVKQLEEKHGRGIFRRFFYWIPSKGVGAVDRSRLPKYASAKGSARLHEFVDIGVPGVVSTRRAACHQCDACWSGNRRACQNAAYCGAPMELQISCLPVPTTSLSRVTRASLEADAVERVRTALVGSYVCIETHKDELTFPWVIGTIVHGVHNANEAISHSATPDAPLLQAVKAGEVVVEVRLWEALEAGSSTYFEGSTVVTVSARVVRTVDVQLEPVRASGRSNLSGHVTARARFTIAKVSLDAIRAAMPSYDDTWEVENVVQYRKYYGVEQWLVKWKGYGEAHNTWEPLDHLVTESARAEAMQVKAAAVSFV